MKNLFMEKIKKSVSQRRPGNGIILDGVHFENSLNQVFFLEHVYQPENRKKFMEEAHLYSEPKMLYQDRFWRWGIELPEPVVPGEVFVVERYYIDNSRYYHRVIEKEKSTPEFCFGGDGWLYYRFTSYENPGFSRIKHHSSAWRGCGESTWTKAYTPEELKRFTIKD